MSALFCDSSDSFISQLDQSCQVQLNNESEDAHTKNLIFQFDPSILSIQKQKKEYEERRERPLQALDRLQVFLHRYRKSTYPTSK